MKKLILATVLLITAWITSYTQVTEAEKQLKTISADTVMGWKKGGVININTSQTSLTNWAAGGQSSMSANGLLSLFAHNKKEKSLWENYLDLGYGTLKQKGSDWWKTDDRIDFTSKYGLKASEKLYYAGLLNFKTQMTDGFNYPNDSVKISGFMAPGYLLTAIGLDYIPDPGFTLFFAPITSKLTFVMDDEFAEAGAFGVDPGENIKSEFGGYLRAFLKKDIMENISVQTKLDLFTNYLEDFGNIDVSWETLIAMKVNKFISATLSTHLLYDQDITIIKENDEGNLQEYNSKVQFKEVLAIGLSMKF
jgi:predicted small secreted protein